MPFRTLWNKLRGGQSSQSAGSAHSEHAASADTVETRGTRTGGQKAGNSSAKESTTKAKLSLFGGSSPHRSLIKQIRQHSASSVLEIGVEDGSRAVEVFQALSEVAKSSVRYFAVDQFELGSGTTTLREFHRTLRSAGVQAHVFPETPVAGLTRFAHTIGTADLILISDPALNQSAQLTDLLRRVCGPGTLLFVRTDQTWRLCDVDQFAQEPLRSAA